VLAGSRVVRALEGAGFKVARIRGSHHVLRHPDGRGTSVPVHKSQEVRAGTLRGILRDCGLTVDEFLNLLDLRSAHR
jgi:predicted RNA binding protein YcfA (HicA-like mRNA interferase family)